MARSQDESEFDKLIIQNQGVFMASRGAKSQFSEIDLPVGEYYAQLLATGRSVFDMDQRDADGNSTGIKVRTGRIQIKLVVIADANPRCPSVEEMLAYRGKQEFINLILPPGDQAASDRCMATLGSIGIPTEQFVPSEQDIKDPNCQMTLAQGLQMIDDSKPYCKIAVTESKGRKYLNYRSAVEQAQLEALIGMSLDDSSATSSSDEQPPFEEALTDAPEWQWSEEHQAWNAPGTDEWFDEAGTPIESPVHPPVKSPPVRQPPARVAARQAPKASPAPPARGAASAARPGTAPGIGSRRLPPRK